MKALLSKSLVLAVMLTSGVRDCHAETGPNDAVHRIGERLASATVPVSSAVRWAFDVDASLVTATAKSLPNVEISIAPSLLDLVWTGPDDDSILASVVAHEMAHVQMLHHRRYQAAVAEGKSETSLKTLARDMEFEADAYAATILERSGFETVNSQRALLDRLIKSEGSARRTQAPGLRRTTLDHPSLMERYKPSDGSGLRRNGGNGPACFNFGLLALRAGRTELAGKCFRKLSMQLPGSWDGLAQYGSVLPGSVAGRGPRWGTCRQQAESR